MPREDFETSLLADYLLITCWLLAGPNEKIWPPADIKDRAQKYSSNVQILSRSPWTFDSSLEELSWRPNPSMSLEIEQEWEILRISRSWRSWRLFLFPFFWPRALSESQGPSCYAISRLSHVSQPSQRVQPTCAPERDPMMSLMFVGATVRGHPQDRCLRGHYLRRRNSRTPCSTGSREFSSVQRSRRSWQLWTYEGVW